MCFAYPTHTRRKNIDTLIGPQTHTFAILQSIKLSFNGTEMLKAQQYGRREVEIQNVSLKNVEKEKSNGGKNNEMSGVA